MNEIPPNGSRRGYGRGVMMPADPVSWAEVLRAAVVPEFFPPRFRGSGGFDGSTPPPPGGRTAVFSRESNVGTSPGGVS